MLRRAITGHRRHHHPQWPSHPAPSILSRPSPGPKPKIPTAPAHLHRQPFSTSPHHADADTSTGPPLLPPPSSSTPESPAKAAHDGGRGGGGDADADADAAAPVPDSRKSSKRTTTEPERATRGSAAQGDASPARQASRSHIVRTRTRALRPLLIPPSFPPSHLLPLTSEPPPPPSEEQTDENGDTPTTRTRTTRTITLVGLPPNTLKTDLRPIFQRFGDVSRIFVDPGGRRADVEFVDADGVRRALHAYAERTLCVRGREIVVFRKHGQGADVGVRRRLLYVRRSERDGGDVAAAAGQGAIFVSDFPGGTLQEELVGALAPLGKYERFVMRTCFFFYLAPS